MKKIYVVITVILALLTAMALVGSVFLLLKNDSGNSLNIIGLSNILVTALTVLYAAIGYKKPHGDLLKYLILIYALSMIPRILQDSSDGKTLAPLIFIIIVICIAYVAGRLDKIGQNKILMPFIIILFTAARIEFEVASVSANIMQFIGRSANLIIWLDICFAYFMRYKQHKEAGLADAQAVKKNK